MMSPMALRRTMSRLSNRGVPTGRAKDPVMLVAARIAIRTAPRFSRLQPRARTNDLGSRVILGIPHNGNSASTGFDLVTLGDALRRVVGALGVKVGADFANEGAHILFWKNNNGVHIRQRSQNFRAFFRRHHGPPFTLQRAHGSIGVDRDNQFATEFPRGMQIAHMADMQHIETPVGQRDAIAVAPPLGHTLLQFVARNYLLME